jgi:hypothetical protein
VPDWDGKLEELTLVNAEVDRELASYVHREASMQSRATILVGAASLVSAVQIGGGFAPLNLATLVLSFVAAVLGVLVVFPRSGDAPNPSRMHRAILEGVSSEEALHRMIKAKLETLDEDEDSLKKRGRLARAGLIILALSILASAIGGLVPNSTQPISAPTETSKAPVG